MLSHLLDVLIFNQLNNLGLGSIGILGYCSYGWHNVLLVIRRLPRDITSQVKSLVLLFRHGLVRLRQDDLALGETVALKLQVLLLRLQVEPHLLVRLPVQLDDLQPLVERLLRFKGYPDSLLFGHLGLDIDIRVLVISLSKHYLGLSKVYLHFVPFVFLQGPIDQLTVLDIDVPFYPLGLAFKHDVALNIWAEDLRRDFTEIVLHDIKRVHTSIFTNTGHFVYKIK